MIFSILTSRVLRVIWVKTPIPYGAAWSWQQFLVEQRRHDPQLDDVLLLLEHPPVYTLGRGANPEFLKFTPQTTGWEVHRIDRGGEVTYHCPGQLVGYPILNLNRHRPDLHWYLRQLEEVIIRVLAKYGVCGARIPGLTGVWVEGRKLAAIGIGVKRWITMHGFALNVCPDLTGFQYIVPCGISDKSVGSLAPLRPDLCVATVVPAVTEAFAEVFGLSISFREVERWDDEEVGR
ncbi:MAG: lipoyl(octanoyl) transferase LipB [Cyanobacteria bacterium SID2]|nr:lipoyl(octanoyl) transferase LipB [Cyanobacteria bacterium SID2]MBP0004111.1 lipoyl(octanoyl) transferase LipB [Cyanobacteria bacterium SBC]